MTIESVELIRWTWLYLQHWYRPIVAAMHTDSLGGQLGGVSMSKMTPTLLS